MEYDRSSLGRLVDHLDAVLQEIHGKLVRGHVEVSRIKAWATRTEGSSWGGMSSQIFLFFSVGIEGQVEVVAVLQHDPSGWPLGHDELVARRRAVVDVHPHRAQLRLVQVGGIGERPSRSCRARVYSPRRRHTVALQRRPRTRPRSGRIIRRSRGSCGGAQPLAFGRLALWSS